MSRWRRQIVCVFRQFILRYSIYAFQSTKLLEITSKFWNVEISLRINTCLLALPGPAALSKVPRPSLRVREARDSMSYPIRRTDTQGKAGRSKAGGTSKSKKKRKRTLIDESKEEEEEKDALLSLARMASLRKRAMAVVCQGVGTITSLLVFTQTINASSSILPSRSMPQNTCLRFFFW